MTLVKRSRHQSQRADSESTFIEYDEDDGWPSPIGRPAYHGITGEIVRAIEPHTEADPNAVLLTHLVYFGNWVGRTAYYEVSGAKHYSNESLTLVGHTSSGRKGTSEAPVRRVYDLACDQGDNDPWVTHCIKGGLSSGEGVIEQVKDEEGVDKRLMIRESEFARVLTNIDRGGNNLSTIIRQTWDDGNIATLTRHNPLVATNAHVSMLGHITIDELRRRLASSEMANGFANRILFAASRRARRLPHGGGNMRLERFAQRLATAKKAAQRVKRVQMSDAAARVWERRFDELTDGRPGLLGAILGRGAPHVLRLALIYALLDSDSEIQGIHLRAAMSVWRYCEESAGYIFGGSTGNVVADRIRRELVRRYPGGMNRRAITKDLFKGNKKSSELDEALSLLKVHGYARMEEVKDTGGRPAQYWYAKM